VLLYEAGDHDGAEAAWRRSVERGNARARENLAYLLRRRREPASPEIAHVPHIPITATSPDAPHLTT
jgi:hypothetical protein